MGRYCVVIIYASQVAALLTAVPSLQLEAVVVQLLQLAPSFDGVIHLVLLHAGCVLQ